MHSSLATPLATLIPDPVLQIYEVQEGHSCFSHLHAQGGGEAAPTVIYKESPLYTVIGILANRDK